MFLSNRKRENYKPDIRTEEGFIALYNKYFQFVYENCFRYMNDDDVSENITSEIFASLWERRDDLYKEKWEKGSWKRYLARAAKHKLIDHLRSKDQLQHYLTTTKQETPHYEETTEREIYHSELANQVDTLIAQLPTRSREVFHLSRSKGLSHKEISEKLDISGAAVNKHITRALNFLREHLTEYSIRNRSTGT
ncbi:MAG: RNA polymerase sigma-70 factor [Bacteroidota bacterium]